MVATEKVIELKKRQIKKIEYDSLSDELRVKCEELKSKFERENIFALREQAKKILVPSATTFSKDDLIQEILKKFVSFYVADQKSEGLSDDLQCTLMEDYRNSPLIDGEERRGFLKLKQAEGELINFDEGSAVYVPYGLINEFSLCSGDYIVVKARKIDKIMGAFDVLEVAGRSKPNQKSEEFDDLVPIKKSETIKALGKNLTKGGRIAVSNLSNEEIDLIAGKAAKTRPKCVTVLLDELPENIGFIKANLRGLCRCALCDSGLGEQEEWAFFMLDVAKTLAAGGEDVLLTVRNLDVLSVDASRKIFGSARCLKKGSLTVIAHTSQENLKRIATEIIE